MKIYERDPWLAPYRDAVEGRNQQILRVKESIAGKMKPLKRAINGAMYYCLLGIASYRVQRQLSYRQRY